MKSRLTCDEVLAGVDLGKAGDLEEDGGQGHEAVGGQVEDLQLPAGRHLRR